jgi:glucosyl-dolichyl phosphate glucuronosyltransferase
VTAGGATPSSEVDERVSVVIPCHSEQRWPQLVAAVASVRAQRPLPAHVVVAVDGNPALFQRACTELTGVSVVLNDGGRGAAGNRNCAVRHTSTPFVALLDDDAQARPGWLAALMAPLDDPGVVGTGGRVVPDWAAGRPSWFPDELLWTVGASFVDAPATPTESRNVWSVTMVVRRAEFDAAGGFQEEFSKVDDRARPEDTDLCLRMSRSGGQWIYVPEAVVDHLVPRSRGRLGYLLRRGYAEGRGKVCLARRHRGRAALRLERAYLRSRLPRAIGRAVWDSLRRRRLVGLLQAGVLMLSTAAAGAGAVVELVRGDRTPAAVAPLPAAAPPLNAVAPETPPAPVSSAATR